MGEKEEGRARRLALAAIALDRPAPAPGPRPTFDELWDWMAGEIEPARVAEIRGHVARDPEVGETWRQLRLAVAERVTPEGSPGSDPARPHAGATAAGGRPPDERPTVVDRFGRWRARLVTFPFGGAFATVAVLGIAFGVALREHPAPFDPWQDWRMPKSARTSALGAAEAAELRAFLVGLRQQMRQLSIAPTAPDGRPLPGETVSCEAADGTCATRRDALEELGRMSLLALRDCALGAAADPLRQARVGERLLALAAAPAVARLVPPLRDWAEADSDRARCAAVGRLVARALLANGAPGE